jgi:hypothetical protein
MALGLRVRPLPTLMALSLVIATVVAGGPAHAGVGDVIWTRQFGTTSPDYVRGVALGPDGGVCVAGSTCGALPGGGQ